MSIFPMQAAINSGADLKQAFAQEGWDDRNLPIAFYDALLSIIEDDARASGKEHYVLDIMAWHCATTYTKLDDSYTMSIAPSTPITPAMYAADEENPTTEELANYLQEHTTVIWYDETTVYHFI